MTRLEIQLSQQANPPEGTFPSQLLPNPKNFRQANEAQYQQPNQCNVVYTLRSEKQVDNQVSMPPNPIQHNNT